MNIFLASITFFMQYSQPIRNNLLAGNQVRQRRATRPGNKSNSYGRGIFVLAEINVIHSIIKAVLTTNETLAFFARAAAPVPSLTSWRVVLSLSEPRLVFLCYVVFVLFVFQCRVCRLFCCTCVRILVVALFYFSCELFIFVLYLCHLVYGRLSRVFLLFLFMHLWPHSCSCFIPVLGGGGEARQPRRGGLGRLQDERLDPPRN